MKKHSIAFLLFLLTVSVSASDVLSRTSVFWGTDGGNVFPGVSVPFGMVKLGPEIRTGWQPTSGYKSDEPIVGFSHTRTSGTGGGPRYGNFLFIPQVDSMRIKELFKYTKLNESGYPSYYTVTLKDKNSYVKAELTASQKVGYHKYTFTKKYSQSNALNANVVIDVTNTLTRLKNGLPETYWTNGYVKIVSPTELQACITCQGGWGGLNPYTIYCYIEFDKPFTNATLWNDGEFISRKELATTNPEKLLKRFGATVSFAGMSGLEVNCKVGLSFLSFEAAMLNLRSEKDKSFNDALSTAENLWLEKLNKIQIKGGSVVAQQLFRSALRNTMLMPTNVTGEVPGWNPNVPHYWDYYCIWDVFRTTMPLYSLIWPDKQREFIQNLLEIYKRRGYLPDAWVAGDYAMMQGGSNSDVVLADAVVKKIGGFDVNLALEATLKNAELQSENPQLKGRYTNDYRKYGWILPQTTSGAVSRTLEYAYNDFCISNIAKNLGYKVTEQKYFDQSINVFNLFYPEYRMFWAKDSAGKWMPDFSPISKRKDTWNDPYFYEGGSQIYSTYVPHAMQTLIDKHGDYD
ncbi:MAG: glycoside hydrolase domain-containing protein [Paludibacter sp.]